MKQSKRREHLIDTAIGLFYERGYHATGIDRILSEAGVSKKTLYTHFRSKEELILAALRKYDGLFRNDFMRRVDRKGATSREKLIAIFDVAEELFSQKRFFGCMFINAVGEYAEEDSPIRAIGKQFKRSIRDYIRELCVQAGAKAPDTLADQLALLFEGATVTAQVSRRVDAAKTAKTIAQQLIARQLEQTGPSK
jgi:AcrR family transcriptional regulator